jgi:GDP-L-fucose synthase
MERHARIFVAGADTLLGAAILRQLVDAGYEGLVGTPPYEPLLDDLKHVDDFFQTVRPEYVFAVAGPSGGIEENRRHPADLMIENLVVATNVIPAAFRHGARKLLYVACSCCYPKAASQPLKVESLGAGPLEPTNEAYAIAKLAGLKICQAYRQQYDAPFITAILANLFGPGDDFHSDTGHVIPALMRRMHRARRDGEASLELWGTGAPRRDFLFVDDAADACIHVMSHYDSATPINIGSGRDWSIAETADLIADLVGYRGTLRFDAARPDGMPRKLLDASPLFELDWRPRFEFAEALERTYAWFLEHEVCRGGGDDAVPPRLQAIA